MLLGEKIKRIRTFRGLTQRELGLQLGYDEKNADVRIAQYESGYRVPKKDTLMTLARVLDVNYINFYIPVPGAGEDIIQTLFWLDEPYHGALNIFKMAPSSLPENTGDDTIVTYNDSFNWPAHSPMGVWFTSGLVDDCLREWHIRIEQLHSGEITEEEYFEWKLNWPYTSSRVDRTGKEVGKNTYQWRKS